jgi:hypothetical protein
VLRALRSEHGQELDAFFAKHPELQLADAEAEGADIAAVDADEAGERL